MIKISIKAFYKEILFPIFYNHNTWLFANVDSLTYVTVPALLIPFLFLFL